MNGFSWWDEMPRVERTPCSPQRSASRQIIRSHPQPPWRVMRSNPWSSMSRQAESAAVRERPLVPAFSMRAERVMASSLVKAV